MRTDQLDILPMLSRGKHRSPKRGACFMELASFLAGERWSDRPRCTHPLLAHMARLVNDCSSDAARPRLAPLIPSVIGLVSDDPRWNHELAHLAARRALPVVAEETQRALAVGLLTLDRLLAPVDGRVDGELRASSTEALDQVPLAAEWGRRFIARGVVVGPVRYHPGPVLLDFAVPGIAAACVPDADDRLHDLLVSAIALCESLRGRSDAAPLRPEQWQPVCQPAFVA